MVFELDRMLQGGESELRAQGMIRRGVVWCDTREVVGQRWLSLEVAIPEDEATHCGLSSTWKIISTLGPNN